SAGNSASRTGREPASHHPGGPQPTPAAPPSLPAGAHRPPRLPPPARPGRNRPAPGAAAPRTPGSSPGVPGELPHAPSIAGTSAADVEPVLPWETSPSEYSGTRPFRDGEVSLLSSLSHLLCYSKVTPSGRRPSDGDDLPGLGGGLGPAVSKVAGARGRRAPGPALTS